MTDLLDDGEADGDGFAMEPVGALSPARVQWLLDNRKAIESYLKTIASYVLEIGGGYGQKVVESNTKRKWINNEDQIREALIGAGLEEEDFMVAADPKLLPFSKVEKMVGKDTFAELGLVEKPEGSPTLVPESDPRPAFTPHQDLLDD
jgi:hypothetical protein